MKKNEHELLSATEVAVRLGLARHHGHHAVMRWALHQGLRFLRFGNSTFFRWEDVVAFGYANGEIHMKKKAGI